jgi:hypothetical protein
MPKTSRPAEFRYGVVFVLVLTVVALLIIAPARDWSYALAFALESAALVVAIATSHARADVRRMRSAIVAVIAVAWVSTVAAGAIPDWLLLAGGGALTLAIPLALGGGLIRLVTERGATLQAVAGSLAIYLLIGLTFAWVIGLVARLGSAPYFADGTDGTESTRVYFSFTVMTTTGFGDLTAENPVGRALAVLEMLVGQLYLVTVIGVLVGNFRRH